MSQGLNHCLSFDVEEHFHVHGFADVIPRSQWDEHPRRAAASTRLILQLLRSANVRATFFILGWVAEREPTLVQEIADDGHEVATHGYWHQAIFNQTPEEFAVDIERSLEAIGSHCPAAKIVGYRAPSFSIVERSMWALDILKRFGMEYDSSVFPCHGHDRYGVPGAQRVGHAIRDGLWEIPPSTYRIAGRNIPVAGGGYFRLYPYSVTRHAIRSLEREGIPAVVYLHPWEFDPEQPVIKRGRWSSRFRHYVNLRKTETRLKRLLAEFRFGAMQDHCPAIGQRAGLSS